MVRLIIIALCCVCLMTPAAGFAASPEEEIQAVQTLMEQGQFDEALRNSERFIAQYPKDPRMRFLKGLILTNQLKWQASAEVFAALTNDFPELPAPFNNLAVVYAELGNYDKAVDMLKEALQIDPGYTAAYENLGDIYVTLAVLAYRDASQHGTDTQTAQAKLALLNRLVPSLSSQESAQRVVATESDDVPTQATRTLADEVQQVVLAWASAWSAQDVDRYLGFYSEQFTPSQNKSLSAWRAERRTLVTRPTFIRIDLANIKTHVVTDQRVEVTFVQKYKSNYFESNSLKTLTLENEGGDWKIVNEATG